MEPKECRFCGREASTPVIRPDGGAEWLCKECTKELLIEFAKILGRRARRAKPASSGERFKPELENQLMPISRRELMEA